MVSPVVEVIVGVHRSKTTGILSWYQERGTETKYEGKSWWDTLLSRDELVLLSFFNRGKVLILAL